MRPSDLSAVREMAVDLSAIMSAIMNWLKLTPSVAWSLVLVIGLILWVPEWLVSGLGLEAFVAGYRHWLGFSFLLSLIAAITPLWRTLGQQIGARYNNFRFVRHGRKRLTDLTPEEKEVLKYFIDNETRTQKLEIDNGVVVGLESEDIIYRAADLLQAVPGGKVLVDFNIHPWAWNYLRKSPTLLE